MRYVSGQRVQRFVLITFSLRGFNPARAQNNPTVASSSISFCTNNVAECPSIENGVCDDGGSGAENSSCIIGTDCSDCGPRGCSSETTDQTCPTLSDGECDDGGPGSEYCVCNIGTDCIDCGLRVSKERPDCAASNTRGMGGSILLFPAFLMPCVIICWCIGMRRRRMMRVHDATMAQARVSGLHIMQYPATYPANPGGGVTYPGGVDHSIIAQAQPVIAPSAVFAAPVATAVIVESYSPTAWDESQGAVAVGVLQGSVQQGNGVQRASPRRRQDPTSEA
jgi:hypothetical protein